MKKLRFLLPPAAAAAVVAAALALDAGGDTGEPASATTGSGSSSGPLTVDIKDFKFKPAEVEVPVGGRITWVNRDAAPHTSTSSGSATGAGDIWDTGNLKQGQKETITYNRAGTFEYICTIHPFMKGTLTVGGGS